METKYAPAHPGPAWKHDLFGRIDKLEALIRNLSIPSNSKKIPIIKSSGRIDYIYANDIVTITAEVSSTHVHLITGEIIISVKPLKYFCEVLTDEKFFRVSKSCVINIDHLFYFDIVDRKAYFSNGLSATISRRSAGAFKEYLFEHAKK